MTENTRPLDIQALVMGATSDVKSSCVQFFKEGRALTDVLQVHGRLTPGRKRDLAARFAAEADEMVVAKVSPTVRATTGTREVCTRFWYFIRRGQEFMLTQTSQATPNDAAMAGFGPAN